VRHAGQELQDTLPIFLYGAAHPQQHTLAGIRRSLGYFQGAMAGTPPKQPSQVFAEQDTCSCSPTCDCTRSSSFVII
jgi:hypothetical protein